MRYKHGFYKHKLYRILADMKNVCYCKSNKDYSYYGGKGITIEDDWNNDFMNFYNWAYDNGYKEGMQIMRVNKEGNYSHDNCIFVNKKDFQAENAKRNNKSGYIGVHKTKTSWQYIIIVKDKIVSKAGFGNPIDAAKARDEFIKKNKLKNTLNFSNSD